MASRTLGSPTTPATTFATSPATDPSPSACPTTTTGCSTRARSPGCTSTMTTTLSAWRSSKTRRRSCSTIPGGMRPGTGPSAGMTLPPNTTSSVTKVHEARRALGLRLRELRRQAGLTGARLAASLSWPASKVSKLENGRQTPTDDDILAWTTATGAPAEAEGLLASLHTLEVQHAEWRRVLQRGLRAHQGEIADLEGRTKVLRAFEATVVPGLLQTAEYARACLGQAPPLFGGADDVDEAVRERLRRQEVLYRPDKRFHFVMAEAALRVRLCADDAMLAQLERLVALTAMRTV